MSTQQLRQGCTYELQTDDALHGMTLTVDSLSNGVATCEWCDGTTLTYDADELDEHARVGTLVVVV